MKRMRWIWLAALGLGLGAGLTFAWVLAPNRDAGSPPNSLRADYKDEWRQTIAASYFVTGDLQRARARLQLLGDPDPIQALGAQAQRALASGGPFEVAQQLALLASDLQAGVPSLPSRTPQSIVSADTPRATPTATTSDEPASPVPAGASPEISATPFPTPSPVVSPTPLPSPSAPFRLVSQDDLCDPTAVPGLLQVTVLDAKGGPFPGVEIAVTWDQGTDRFFTGLQPEISPGYADYTMKAGTKYALQVARLGSPISGLTPPVCTSADNQPFLGGLQLTFAAP